MHCRCRYQALAAVCIRYTVIIGLTKKRCFVINSCCKFCRRMLYCRLNPNFWQYFAPQKSQQEQSVSLGRRTTLGYVAPLANHIVILHETIANYAPTSFSRLSLPVASENFPTKIFYSQLARSFHAGVNVNR